MLAQLVSVKKEDLQNLMVNCAVYGDHPMCAGMNITDMSDSEDEFEGVVEMENLNMFKKMGKGLKKFEKTAKKARDYGKKVYPVAEQAWAIAAPKNHDKYAPKLAKGYKTFNDEANKMGGWNTVEKAANTLEGAGLQNLLSYDEIEYIKRLRA